MLEYIMKPRTVRAKQWFKKGDIEGVLSSEEASLEDIRDLKSEKSICESCGGNMNNHGYIIYNIDNTNTLTSGRPYFVVCPGDFVIEGEESLYNHKPIPFLETYELKGVVDEY